RYSDSIRPTRCTPIPYTTLFRSRSGIFTYRPYCDGCQACIPVRVKCEEFAPSRTQRRAWKRHGDLVAMVANLAFSDEHYALYLRDRKSTRLNSSHVKSSYAVYYL